MNYIINTIKYLNINNAILNKVDAELVAITRAY